MIFVTVGTHEQQFNRLIKEVDGLKKKNIIKDSVFIQTGYSDYIPKYCDYKKFLTYDEIEEHMTNATIVITHGGPASFMKSIAMGKKTIIVPRLKRYSEHVNDHQKEFLEKINLNYVERINDLMVFLTQNEKLTFKAIFDNNKNFCRDLKKLLVSDF